MSWPSCGKKGADGTEGWATVREPTSHPATNYCQGLCAHGYCCVCVRFLLVACVKAGMDPRFLEYPLKTAHVSCFLPRSNASVQPQRISYKLRVHTRRPYIAPLIHLLQECSVFFPVKQVFWSNNGTPSLLFFSFFLFFLRGGAHISKRCGLQEPLGFGFRDSMSTWAAEAADAELCTAGVTVAWQSLKIQFLFQWDAVQRHEMRNLVAGFSTCWATCRKIQTIPLPTRPKDMLRSVGILRVF